MEEVTKITLRNEETCNCAATRALSVLKEDKEFCDVIIKAEGRSFSAHRNILAAKFLYFRTMFNSNMAECSKKEIEIKDVDADLLECLTNFAYTGKLEIAADKVVSLLSVSTYWQLDVVSSICTEYSLNHLGAENAPELYAFAKDHEKPYISEIAKRYITTNFNEISRSETLGHLPPDKVRELISGHDLYTICEEEVLEPILSWIKESPNYESKDFKESLDELLRQIRMSLLYPRYLLQRIYDDRLIRKSLHFQSLLEAVDKSLMPMDMLERNFPKPKERQCEEKQHLKCAYLMGRGLYSVSMYLNHMLKINYYDHLQQLWIPLSETKLESEIVYYTFCTKENIYFIGNGWLSSFNFQTLAYSWSQMEIVPPTAGIALHDEKIYFFGDSANKPILRFDFLLGNSCELAGQMLTPRRCARATSLGENIYVTGGYYDTNPLISAEKYNPITKQSTGIADMNMARAQHGICALNGKIYVCGGICRGDIYPLDVITGEFYDPLINKWTLFPLKTPNPRSPVSLVAYGPRMYAINQFPNDSHFLVEIYDPFDKEWKSEESIPTNVDTRLCALTTGSASAIPLTGCTDFSLKPPVENVISTGSKKVIRLLQNSSDSDWFHRFGELHAKNEEATIVKEIRSPIQKSSGSGFEAANGMFNFAFWTEDECDCESSKMWAVLEDMKDSDELCDVIIKAGGECFKAHRNILAARERDTKIRFNIKETEQREIVLNDVDPAAIECLLNYVYTGRFEIPHSKVKSLFRASLRLQIHYIFEYFLRRPEHYCSDELRTVAEEAKDAYAEMEKYYLKDDFHEI